MSVKSEQFLNDNMIRIQYSSLYSLGKHFQFPLRMLCDLVGVKEKL